MTQHKITPFLWFDTQAEEAAKFYVSIFPRSKIVSTMPGPGGTTMGLTFELDGQTIMALNGGPHYKLTPACSLYVSCDTQEEIDAYWEKLSDGGKITMCGWLDDRFGLTWQIIPSVLSSLIGDSDRKAAGRAMDAMMKMKKLDIAALEKAHAG